MAILDVARCIQELGKYVVTAPPTYFTFNYTVPGEFPFMSGVVPTFQTNSSNNTIEPLYGFDFATAPDKPTLGQTFGFRYSRLYTASSGGNSNNVAGQWLWQFKDATGNILGGLRHGPVTNSRPITRGYELVAGSSVFNIGGHILYPTGHNDCAITCYVDANEIIVSMYCNDGTAMNEGQNLTLIGTISHDNTTLGYGPVSRFNVEPNHASGSYVNGLDIRDGSDHAAIIGCVFSVDEDVSNLFVTNNYSLTTTGATLTDLAITGTPAVFANNAYLNFSGYFNAVRDQRRTFKLANVTDKTLPTFTYDIISINMNVNFGLSSAARSILATNTEMELFTRFDSVNYSLGRFGNNMGSTNIEMTANPATLLPFESFSEFEIGIVLREKI